MMQDAFKRFKLFDTTHSLKLIFNQVPVTHKKFIKKNLCKYLELKKLSVDECA